MQAVLFVSASDGCVQVNKWGRNRCRGEIIDVIGPVSYLVNAGRPVMSVEVEFTDTHLPENPKQTFFFCPPPACLLVMPVLLRVAQDFCHFRSRRSKLLDSTAVTSPTDSSCYQHFQVDNIHFDISV